MPSNNKKKLLDERFSSSPENRREILESLINFIEVSGIKLCLSRDELFLAMDEAVTNAMEHGNNWDPAKNVRIILENDQNELFARIVDEGSGFNTDDIKNRMLNRDKLSIRGRGIFIMNQFCKVSWNDKGNELTLSLKKCG